MLDDFFAFSTLLHELLSHLERLRRNVRRAESFRFTHHACQQGRRCGFVDEGRVETVENVEADFGDTRCSKVDDVYRAKVFVFWAVINRDGGRPQEKVGVVRGKGTEAGAIWRADDDNKIVTVVVAGNADVIIFPSTRFRCDGNNEVATLDDVGQSVDLSVIDVHADGERINILKISTNIGERW